MTHLLGLVAGYVADRTFGDPRRWHPVAGFGRVAAALERVTYADARANGVAHVAVLVGAAALAGRRVPVMLATWVVLGGTSLDREAAEVERLLAVGDLDAARRQVARLVGRDTSALDEHGVARAALESVAENTSDAVVAPLVWGALLGAPGLLAYRAANTLDAMVGHRSPRYERFGWAAARLDDLLNLPGSRLTALLATVLGDDHAGAWRVWRRDARHHPSPNAGPVEAAFAGALGVRLGGVNVYAGRPEDRHVLGDGRPPMHEDLARARVLARRIGWAALGVVGATALLRRRR
ncbi:cobalamin biosynthesis protein [uncultured Nocardioides sp.]|uniref:cobalamin biosynthesis protein n=1 Tax=uncultured Nocardioides sp. TaxID=198441 RepID=UPI00261FCB43|nr:cobalamin biosynthesis protein [uncultured Nocardioides sp.]